uniref:Glycoprotein G n=1 Tax=Macropodid alphaherpesvirus 2 TaxID=83440 RepID=Q8JNC6_9ALPH|nr:glycoprotein G [Macropodid alphaherpesvirus 2]
MTGPSCDCHLTFLLFVCLWSTQTAGEVILDVVPKDASGSQFPPKISYCHAIPRIKRCGPSGPAEDPLTVPPHNSIAHLPIAQAVPTCGLQLFAPPIQPPTSPEPYSAQVTYYNVRFGCRRPLLFRQYHTCMPAALPSAETCQRVSYTYHRGTPPNRYALVDTSLLAPVVDVAPQIYEYEIILGAELHHGRWIVSTNTSARCTPNPPPHLPTNPSDICVSDRPHKSAWRRISPRLLADINVAHTQAPEPAPACVQTPATIVNFPYVAYASQDILIGRTNQQLHKILYNIFIEDPSKKRKGEFVRFPNIRAKPKTPFPSGRRKLLSLPSLSEELEAVSEAGSGFLSATPNNIEGEASGLGSGTTGNLNLPELSSLSTINDPISLSLTTPKGPSPPAQLSDLRDSVRSTERSVDVSLEIPQEEGLTSDPSAVTSQEDDVSVSSSSSSFSMDSTPAIEDDYSKDPDLEDLGELRTNNDPVFRSTEFYQGPSEPTLGVADPTAHTIQHHPSRSGPAKETSAHTYPREVSPTTSAFPPLETARLVDIVFLGGLLAYAVTIGLLCLGIYAHTHVFSKRQYVRVDVDSPYA